MKNLLRMLKARLSIVTTIEKLASDVATMASSLEDLRVDVKAVKSDVNAVKSDVNAVKGDVNAVKGDLNAVKCDLNAVKGDVEVVKGRVDFLSTVFPEVVAASCPRCVLPSGVQSPPRYGDTATWSLLRHDGNLYAVGCAHCAFAFSTLSGPTVVNIPPCLISHVRALLVVPGYLKAFPRHPWARGKSLALSGLPTCYDFAAFELEPSFAPRELCPVEWPSSITDSSRRGHGVVAGVAHSGDVTGDRLYWAHQKNGDKYMGFVERRGEAGNSGTLMFTADSAHQLRALGVYCGVEPQEPQMNFRGRICPLPRFNTLRRYKVRRPVDGEGFTIYSPAGPWHINAAEDCITDCDNANCPIVVVCDGQEELPRYCGMADCGCCRSIFEEAALLKYH